MVDTLPSCASQYRLCASWWERCPISSGDDTQVEVQGCTGQVAKVSGESDHKTFTLAVVLHEGNTCAVVIQQFLCDAVVH